MNIKIKLKHGWLKVIIIVVSIFICLTSYITSYNFLHKKLVRDVNSFETAEKYFFENEKYFNDLADIINHYPGISIIRKWDGFANSVVEARYINGYEIHQGGFRKEDYDIKKRYSDEELIELTNKIDPLFDKLNLDALFNYNSEILFIDGDDRLLPISQYFWSYIKYSKKIYEEPGDIKDKKIINQYWYVYEVY